MTRTERRVDWPVVILQITRQRTPVREIARQLDRSHSTVLQWFEGNSVPKHHDGEAILDLWSALTANGRDSAPRVGQTRGRSTHGPTHGPSTETETA